MTASWWQATRRALLGTRDNGVVPLPARVDDLVDQLLANLPPPARDLMRRRLAQERTRPRTVDDVLDLVKGWSLDAGIAEGRGGYPGGSNAPGWSHYVAEQRSFLAIHHAATALSGEAGNAHTTYFHDLDATFAPSRRLMGEGCEPHVDEEAGRLLYGLPVESGIVGWVFSFEIRRGDLDILRSDPHRRAVLESIAQTKLQHSMVRGSQPVTPLGFSAMVASTLHSTPDDLRRYIAAVDREHNIDTGRIVTRSMTRRSQD